MQVRDIVATILEIKHTLRSKSAPSVAVDTDGNGAISILEEYGLKDPLPDTSLNHIVELTARLFGVPTAFVSLLEPDRQYFHAKIGLSLCETSRNVAFCSLTILQNDPLIVLDTHQDERFCHNPLVTGHPGLRFYAGIPLLNEAGQVLGTLCVADTKPRSNFNESDHRNLRDLSRLVLDRFELSRLSAARHSSQSRFENIAGTSPDGIICADEHGQITFWNSAAERLFGYSAQQMYGQSIDVITPQTAKVEHRDQLKRLSVGGVARLIGKTVELSARHCDGTEFPIELSLSMWHENGRLAFGAIMRDIRERRSNEARLFRLAHLDPLTELANRTVLHERMGALLAAGVPVAVLLIDLDGFKAVNDTLGHAAGDHVLIEAAQRLLACTNPINTVSRIGGDEFVVALHDLGDPLHAAAIAERIVQVLSSPYCYDGRVIRLSASVGIAIGPAHGQTAADILSCADMALYGAKADGRRREKLYTPVLRDLAQRENACREQLHQAVEQNEFVLFYQPQVRLSDGAIVGAEALIRWQHPVRGLLAPGAFLTTLDASPYAAEVGTWVMRSACRQAEAWRARGLSAFRIGVNLCSAQLQRGDLTEVVTDALLETGLPGSNLELEITENIILENDAALAETLRALRNLEVGIAFDDYGTGYASLSLLKRFPLTRLKIDRSFVTGLCESQQDAAIVRAVVSLSRSFGLDVIAEGVETQHQPERLVAKGCREAQGYLFGRPMRATEFEARFVDPLRKEMSA